MTIKLSTVVGFSKGVETTAAAEADALRTKALVSPAAVPAASLPADEFQRIAARRANFDAAATKPPAQAQILGLWTASDRGGLPRMRWHGPGDSETFYMSVKVSSGSKERVTPELWTNINHNANPSDFEAYPMSLSSVNGDVAIYKVSIPIERLGNFRVTGRISTSGRVDAPQWQWAKDGGVSDVRFRPHAVENENLAEQVVHVGLANADSGAATISTFRDLMDEGPGKYNLDAIKAAGKNAIRLQPPFVANKWDKLDPHDTLGSPYAVTDFFSIDPRYSRDCQRSGVPAWDTDRLREIANAEFWDFVKAAHAKGLKVILDIALNHTGHNTTIRDLFDDPVVGEKVIRDNFDQLTINPEQQAAVAKRLAANPADSGEDLFPEMFAARTHDPDGAHSPSETIGGGNGEWADTKQLNTGAFNWGGQIFDTPINRSVTDWHTRILKYWSSPPPSEQGAPADGHGVDGFRLDHSTNLPPEFWERSLTQLQGMVDHPLAFIQEDFNQQERLRVFGDAMESGWYKDLIQAFKTSNVEAALGIVTNDYFFETLRGGNHDEERIVKSFDGDLMATGRYLAMLDLFGGISTTVMGDEFGEGRKLEFKKQGAVPPVLEAFEQGALPQANLDLREALRRAGVAKTNDPSFKTVLRTALRGDGPNRNILALARFADDPKRPPGLVFANLANRDAVKNNFRLDDQSRARIDPNGWYVAKDLMADDPTANVWGGRIKGSDLLEKGVYVELRPYQIQALSLEKVG